MNEPTDDELASRHDRYGWEWRNDLRNVFDAIPGDEPTKQDLYASVVQWFEGGKDGTQRGGPLYAGGFNAGRRSMYRDLLARLGVWPTVITNSGDASLLNVPAAPSADDLLKRLSRTHRVRLRWRQRWERFLWEDHY